MANRTIPVDVVRAGTFLYFGDIDLTGYYRRNEDKNQFYKLIKTDTNAIVSFNYNIKYQYFSVRASVPKVLYGTNVCDIAAADVDTFIGNINNILAKENILKDFSDFKISVIEIANNYHCDSEEDKNQYIDYLSKSNISRKRKDIYPTSVVFKNKQSRLTVYDKSAELLDKNPDAELSEDMKNILRVEYTLHKNALKQYSKNLTVKVFLKEFDLKKILLSEHRKSGLNLKFLHKKDFSKILNRRIKNKRKETQKRIKIFYHDLNQYGENYVESIYSSYQIHEYKKLLTDIGYNPIFVSNHINIINFMDLNERKIEVKMIERVNSTIHKNIKILNQNVRVFLSHYFRCTFFQQVFNFFDTS